MSLERGERCGGVCVSIIVVHLATHAFIPTYPLVCTEHALNEREREKKACNNFGIDSYVTTFPSKSLTNSCKQSLWRQWVPPRLLQPCPPGLRCVLVMSVMKTQMLRCLKRGPVEGDLSGSASGSYLVTGYVTFISFFFKCDMDPRLSCLLDTNTEKERKRQRVKENSLGQLYSYRFNLKD